jgi:hypothetical protein
MAEGFITRRGGGVDVSDATATENEVLETETFYSGDKEIKTGTMVNQGAINHNLSINGNFTIPQGYHNGSGQITQNISTKGVETFTPGTTNQTISSGQYLSGTQTILGDSDLISSNIKNGVTIFGVNGNLSSADLNTPILNASGQYVGQPVHQWLYYEGNEYTSVTGGWRIGTPAIGSNFTFTKEANRMKLQSRNGSARWFIETANSFDMANVGSVYVEWEYIDIGSFPTGGIAGWLDPNNTDDFNWIGDIHFSFAEESGSFKSNFSRTVDAFGNFDNVFNANTTSRRLIFAQFTGGANVFNRNGTLYIYKVGYTLKPTFR